MEPSRGDITPGEPRRTAYDGPVATTRLEFHGHGLILTRPADPDRMLDDPGVHAWNRDDDYMPYWAYLWPGALLLAEAVAREPWDELMPGRRPLEVLEIGCGIGLAGLVALRRGLRVCFSDYDPAALEFVARNAAENGFDPSLYSTRHLDWRDLPDESFPVILGSDVLYERRLVPLVADLLGRLLAAGGLGLISCPGRASAGGFPEALASRGLDCRADSLTANAEDGLPVRGIVYRVRTGTKRRSAFTLLPPTEIGSPGRPGTD